MRLINPDDARQPKRVVFTKSGNEFTVVLGIFDADLDVNLARYEFLDGNGQLVEQAFDVDLTRTDQPEQYNKRPELRRYAEVHRGGEPPGSGKRESESIRPAFKR